MPDSEETMQMPIFRRSGDDETYNEKALREARRQREKAGREVEKENKRTGGKGTAAERRPNARDEEDIQHLRGWLLGGSKGTPNVNAPTPAGRRQEAKNKREKQRQDRERDRRDAERSRKDQRRVAQQSAAADRRQARADTAATGKETRRTRDANIKGYDPKDRGKGRKIENERARLTKKHGSGSKQVRNFGKKNPPPAPKKGFWS